MADQDAAALDAPAQIKYSSDAPDQQQQQHQVVSSADLAALETSTAANGMKKKKKKKKKKKGSAAADSDTIPDESNQYQENSTVAGSVKTSPVVNPIGEPSETTSGESETFLKESQTATTAATITETFDHQSGDATTEIAIQLEQLNVKQDPSTETSLPNQKSHSSHAFESEVVESKEIDGNDEKLLHQEVTETSNREVKSDSPVQESGNGDIFVSHRGEKLPWESNNEAKETATVFLESEATSQSKNADIVVQDLNSEINLGSVNSDHPSETEEKNDTHDEINMLAANMVIAEKQQELASNKHTVHSESATLEQNMAQSVASPGITDAFNHQNDLFSEVKVNDSWEALETETVVHNPIQSASVDLKILNPTDEGSHSIDDLFKNDDSQNDDFAVLIQNGSNSGDEEAVGKDSSSPKKKPNKFSFLEIELDDDLLEEDDLLPDETNIVSPSVPDARLQSSLNPLVQTYHEDFQKPTNTYAAAAEIPKTGPYSAQQANSIVNNSLNNSFGHQPNALSSQATSLVDIGKLNENKKKSDAYDFPLEMVSTKPVARPARAIAQPFSPQLSQQAIAAPPVHTLRTSQSNISIPTSGFAIAPPSLPATTGPTSFPNALPTSRPLQQQQEHQVTRKQSSFFEELPIPPFPASRPTRRASNFSIGSTGSTNIGSQGYQVLGSKPLNSTQVPGNIAVDSAPSSNNYVHTSQLAAPPKVSKVTNKYSHPDYPKAVPESVPVINQLSPVPAANQYSPVTSTTSFTNPITSQSKPSKYTPTLQAQPQMQPAGIPVGYVPPSVGVVSGLNSQLPASPAPHPYLSGTTGSSTAPHFLEPMNTVNPPPIPSVKSPIASAASASRYAPINHKRQPSSTAAQYDPYSISKLQGHQLSLQNQHLKLPVPTGTSELKYQQQPVSQQTLHVGAQIPTQPILQQVQVQPLQPAVQPHSFPPHPHNPLNEKISNPEQLLKRQFPLFSWGDGKKVAYYIPPATYTASSGIKIVSTEKVLNDVLLKEFPIPSKKNISLVDKLLDNQIQMLSSSFSSKAEELELLLARIIKYKLSGSTEPFNFGEFPNFSEQSSSSFSGLNTGIKEMNKRQIVSLISAGQKGDALSLALQHQNFALSLYISSLMSREVWFNAVENYMRHEFKGASGDFLIIISRILTGDVDSVMKEIMADEQKRTWVLSNWKAFANAVILNNPPSLTPFSTAFGEFLIDNGETTAGYILFVLANLPLTKFSQGKSVRLSLLLEIYGFCLKEKGLNTDMTLVLLEHAYYLADYNLLLESQKYLDTAIASLKSSKYSSDQMVSYSIKLLSERLSTIGVTEGGWFARPKLDKVWGHLDKSLSKFISGDETLNSEVQETGGVFSKFSPSVSRSASYLSLQNPATTQTQPFQNRTSLPTIPNPVPNRSSTYTSIPGLKANENHAISSVGQFNTSYAPPPLGRTNTSSSLKSTEGLGLNTIHSNHSSVTNLNALSFNPTQEFAPPRTVHPSQSPKPSRYAPPIHSGNGINSSRRSSVHSHQSYASEDRAPAPFVPTKMAPPPPLAPQVTSVVAPYVDPQDGYTPTQNSTKLQPPPKTNASKMHHNITPQILDDHAPHTNATSAPAILNKQKSQSFNASQIPLESLGTKSLPQKITSNTDKTIHTFSQINEGLNRSMNATSGADPTPIGSHTDAKLEINTPKPVAKITNSSQIDESGNAKFDAKIPSEQKKTSEELPVGESTRLTADHINPSFPTDQGNNVDDDSFKHQQIREESGPIENTNDVLIDEEEEERILGYQAESRKSSVVSDFGSPVATPYVVPNNHEHRELLEDNGNAKEHIEKHFNNDEQFANPHEHDKIHEAQTIMSRDTPRQETPPRATTNRYAPPGSLQNTLPVPNTPYGAANIPKLSSKQSSSSRFVPKQNKSYTPSSVGHESENPIVDRDVDFYSFGYQASPAVENVESKVYEPQAEKTAKNELDRENVPSQVGEESGVSKLSQTPVVAPTNGVGASRILNHYASTSAQLQHSPKSSSQSRFSPYEPTSGKDIHESNDEMFSPIQSATSQPSRFTPYTPSNNSSNSSKNHDAFPTTKYEPPSANFTAYEPPKTHDVSVIPEDEEFFDDVVEDEDDEDEETVKDNKSSNLKKEEQTDKSGNNNGGSGWFTWLKKDKNQPKVYKVKLGNENSFVYDDKLKRWVNKNATPEELAATVAPPPPPPIIKKRPSTIGKPRSTSVDDSPHHPAPSPVGDPIGPGPSRPNGVNVPGPALSKRPTVGASGSDLDSLISLSGAGTSARRKKRGGRGYVDVMKSMQESK